MLNCCRAEVQQPLANGFETAAGGGRGGCWPGLAAEEQCDDDDDDDEGEFYDTLEYAQHSDDEDESAMMPEGEGRQHEQQQRQQQQEQSAVGGDGDLDNGDNDNSSGGDRRTRGDSLRAVSSSTAGTPPTAESEHGLEARHAEIDGDGGDPVLETSVNEKERDGGDLVLEDRGCEIPQDGGDDARSVARTTTGASATTTSSSATAAAVEAVAAGERLSDPSSSSAARTENVVGAVAVDNDSHLRDGAVTALPKRDEQQQQHPHVDVIAVTAIESTSSATSPLSVPPNEPPSPAAQGTAATPIESAAESAGYSTMRLLRSGAAVRFPVLRASGPLTEDMLEQQKLSQAGVYRGRAVLVADMEAFREANGRETVFADFVRWYRPECWQV